MTLWMSRRNLRTKAIALVLTVIIVGLLATGTASIVQTNQLIAAQQRQSVESLAQGLARACELPLAVGDRTELSRMLGRFVWDKYVLFTAVYDGQHQLQASHVRNSAAWDRYLKEPTESQSALIATAPVELSREENEFSVFDSGGSPTSAPSEGPPSAPASSPARKVVGYVVVALSAEPMRLAQYTQTSVTLSLTLLAAVVSGAVVFWAVTRWTRRLHNLVTASERIAQGDFTFAVGDVTEDEIGRLSKAYEGMRKAVQQRTSDLIQVNEQIRQAQADLVQAEKMGMLGQLVAGVAHEINTPTGAIMNIVTEAATHLRELAAAAGGLGRLDEESRQWLTEALPRILVHRATLTEATDRKVRREMEANLERQGLSEPQRAAQVLIDCGLNPSDPQAVRCLSQDAGLDFLEHLIALRVGSEISLLSVQKIAKIVKALRYYSRSGEGELFDIRLDESIDNTLIILQNRIKQVANVERSYEENLPSVRCGPDISQVWTNILSNACDAIEETGLAGQGLIRITLARRDDEIVAEIFNVGPPIPAETLPKIFDPFFTTKPIGKGTGLGLSICTGILHKYHGTITARNRDSGVAFEVALPLHRGEANDAKGTPSGAGQRNPPSAGPESR